MSTSPWSEYLDGYATYLDDVRRALAAGRCPPADPPVGRPAGPVPDEYAWKVLQLVGEATGVLGDGHAPRTGLGACRAMVQWVRMRVRRHELSSVA